MAREKKNITSSLQFNVVTFILFILIQIIAQNLFAQTGKTATIKLDFIKADSLGTCQATVISDGKPVVGPEIHLYVKRMYSLLPVGKVVATDSTGVANIDFPQDLPGDKNGMLTVIARIEKDDKYGTVETESKVNWGTKLSNESLPWNDRSLSASREKAPMFLVVASTSIILLIWGTIFYVIFQLFRVKRSARAQKKLKIQN